MGEKGQVLEFCLGYQHPIKGISMKNGQTSGSEGMGSGDREFNKFCLLQYLRIALDQLFSFR